jgi:hypothetical protein
MFVVVALTVLLAGPLRAEGMAFDGCTDAKGNPVPALADDKLPAVAQLGLAEGKPVIRYNPNALPRLLLETRLFIYAHECGRQYLGFAVEGPRTASEARQADCWAYSGLKRTIFADAQVTSAVEDDLAASTEDWTELPGPARELHLASCTAGVSAKGSLKLPAGPGRDKWNTCQQACGSKLYSCGRSNGCEAAFNQCSVACGK